VVDHHHAVKSGIFDHWSKIKEPTPITIRHPWSEIGKADGEEGS
jgi:hypothetical protein